MRSGTASSPSSRAQTALGCRPPPLLAARIGALTLFVDLAAAVRGAALLVIIVAPLAAEFFVDLKAHRVAEVDMAVRADVEAIAHPRFGLRPTSRTMLLNGPPVFFVPT